MTATDAQAKWSDACDALVTGGVVWLNGNREPLAVSLSRHVEPSIELTELAAPRSDWKAVVIVTAKTDDEAKTEYKFHLCVE